MKKIVNESRLGNLTVKTGEHAVAENLAEVAGYVRVEQGASLTAPALAKAGDVVVAQGASLTAPEFQGEVFREIANCGAYALCRSNGGRYIAGCRGPWTAEQALLHWDGRCDRRATLFAAAIRAAEAENKQQVETPGRGVLT